MRECLLLFHSFTFKLFNSLPSLDPHHVHYWRSECDLAVVKDGVVTLRGGVKSKHQRERIRDEIGRIPGVVRVDDQLEAGDPTGRGSSTTQNY